jgi:hypothetical protein
MVCQKSEMALTDPLKLSLIEEPSDDEWFDTAQEAVPPMRARAPMAARLISPIQASSKQ